MLDSHRWLPTPLCNSEPTTVGVLRVISLGLPRKVRYDGVTQWKCKHLSSAKPFSSSNTYFTLPHRCLYGNVQSMDCIHTHVSPVMSQIALRADPALAITDGFNLRLQQETRSGQGIATNSSFLRSGTDKYLTQNPDDSNRRVGMKN